MRKQHLLLTLLMMLCMGTTQAATTLQSGLYRLTSGRGTNNVMTVNSAGKLVTAKQDTTDLKQVWIITAAGGTYKVRNAGNALYAQNVSTVYANFTTAANAATFYIRQNTTVTSGTYFNICNNNTFTGTQCMHEDAGGQVVPWSPSTTATPSGTEWICKKVTNFTTAQIKDYLKTISGYASAEDGKIYRIISPTYQLAMSENTAAATVGTAAPANDFTQYWKLVKSGTGYNIQNVVTKHYIQKQNGTVSVVYLAKSTSNGTFTIQENKNFPYDPTYDIVDNGNVALHCAATQGYNVVGWYTCTDGVSNAASVWNFQQVTPTDDDIAAAQKEYQDVQDQLNNLSTYKALLTDFFEDYACTTLKSNFTSMADEALRDTMKRLPSAIQDMAIKVKNNAWAKWEKEFRVAPFTAYSDPAYWADKLQMSAYGRQNGPTGIAADKNQLVYIYVDSNVPSGATLTVETTSTTSVWGTTSKTLTRGLNMIVSPEDNTQFYIIYKSFNGSDISKYTPINIHIEGGRVNGYFDCTKHSDADWVEMQNDKLFTAPVIDVLGQYVHWHMNRAAVIRNTSKAVKPVMDIWDHIVARELDLMGLTKSEQYPDIYEDIYPRKFNNRMECVSVTGDNYMYSTSYLTAYNESTLDVVLNYSKIGAGDGSIWGPAHEIGHSNQGAIKLVGTTEISNNLFSNMIVYSMGKCTSRYWDIQEMQPYLADKLSWLEIYKKNSEHETIGTMNRMFFQLYLYYHVLGYHPTFYQELFKKLRKDPLVHPTSPSITYAKNDYLKFAKFACQVAGQDLSEYFEYWGFFRPVSNITVDDYASWTVTATQAEIDQAKAAMKACGKPNGNIIFVEDRVKTAYSDAGVAKTAFDDYSTTNCKNEMGQYTDYPLNLEASSYVYSVDATGIVTIPPRAVNAVGVKVYDKNGNLAYVSATHRFTLPAYLVSEGGYRIVAAQSDGTDIPLYNSSTDTYYTMRVYRGQTTPIIRYTDGTEASGTIPTLRNNDMAVITEAAAPQTLTQMNNVIDANGLAQNVVLDNTHRYYAPKSYTASKVSFTYHYAPRFNAQCMPFEIKKSDMKNNCILQAFVGQLNQDGTDYVIVCDTVTTIGAGKPFLIYNPNFDSSSWTIEKQNEPMFGSASSFVFGDLTTRGTFEGKTIGQGNYLINPSGSAFEQLQQDSLLNGFAIWFESTSATKPATYVIAHDKLVGIQSVKDKNASQETIYDLQGRRVPVAGRGLYIVNKKKVLLK